MITLLGILFGLTTALSQTVAYVFSRIFVIRHKHAFWQLLIVSHVYMGIAALIALLFLWPDNPPPVRQYIAPLIALTFFYLGGQCCLLLAMRFTNPSRIAPLLGTKIIILAILATCFFDKTTTPLQWLAVILCFAAVLTLNFSGGSLSLKSIGLLLATCTLYSLSDLNIDKFINNATVHSPMHTAIWGATMSYAMLGIIATPVALIIKPKMIVSDIRLSLPFSMLWLIAIITLFFCIGIVGPLFSVILQSSRGIMAIILGGLLAKKGWSNIEVHVSRKTFMQRIAAAILLILAVTLYAFGRPSL